MAQAVGHSPSTIHQIWQAFGLQPYRAENFELSSDPFFVKNVRDIIDLYMAPPERTLVLCVDEKSQIQALDRSQPLLPMRPSQAERRTHDYTEAAARARTTRLTRQPLAPALLRCGTWRWVDKCGSQWHIS